MRPPEERPGSTFRVFGRADEHYAEDDALDFGADAAEQFERAEEDDARESDPFAAPSLAEPPVTDLHRSTERNALEIGHSGPGAGAAFDGSAPSASEGGGNGAVIAASPTTSTAAPAEADDAMPQSRSAWYRDGAVWAHLGPLAGSVLIVTGFGLIPPLLIENTIGRRDDFVRDQAREALGFQLTLALVNYAALLTATAPLVWPLALAFGVVLPIVAAVDAAHGRRHRYPLVPRWLD